MVTDRIAVYVLGTAALALAVAAGTQTWRLHSAETEHAKAVADYESRIGAAERTAREASEKNRALEGNLAAKAKENNDALTAERAATARVAADLAAAHAVNGRLRNSIAAYAAGSGGAASAPAAPAGERAEALGGLLGTALQASAECARDAEALGTDLRAVLRDNRDIRETLTVR